MDIYLDKVKEIVSDIKNGKLSRMSDEKFADGFWDLAGQISIIRQLREQQKTNQESSFEPVFINESEQEVLYGIFWEIVEKCIFSDFD